MRDEGKQRGNVGHCIVGVQFILIRHQCDECGRNKFFGVFRWQLAFFGTLAQEVGAFQRE